MSFNGVAGDERLVGTPNRIGALDDARTYNRELSAGDVTSVFNAGPLFIPERSGTLLVMLGSLAALRRRRS